MSEPIEIAPDILLHSSTPAPANVVGWVRKRAVTTDYRHLGFAHECHDGLWRSWAGGHGYTDPADCARAIAEQMLHHN